MTFEELQKTISIQFNDQNLLKAAFIHRSYLNEAHGITQSNERLEFLGDAVLSFHTSHFLFTKYPKDPEGILTNIRSSLVKTKSLADSARELHLGNLLFLSRGEEESGGRANNSLLADTFEALLGAIFLDQGIDKAREFLSAHLYPKVEEIVKNKSYIDYKSLLQEIIQSESRVSPTYRVTNSEGPDHDKTFWVQVSAGSRVLGSGQGKSKQEAESAAAARALEALGKL
jgi:ribonuclease-3